jgi:hypothetical protein
MSAIIYDQSSRSIGAKSRNPNTMVWRNTEITAITVMKIKVKVERHAAKPRQAPGGLCGIRPCRFSRSLYSNRSASVGFNAAAR